MRLIFLLTLLLFAHPAAARPARAYVAASLADAAAAAAAAYASTGAERPVVVAASSSELARQLAAGAPPGLVVLADTRWSRDLARRGLLGSVPVALAGNRLVLVVPARERRVIAIAPGFDLGGLAGVRRWVTADPASVPLGRYAQAALTALGGWDDARLRLVRAADARAALAFVERGDVAMGIVYATDARTSRRVAVAGVFPGASYPPIVYPLALTRGAPVEAAAFARFLRGPRVAAILRARGFVPPPAAAPRSEAGTAAP